MKQSARKLLVLLVALAAMAGLAVAQDALIQVRHDAMLGDYLTTADGMTLYIFSNDSEGLSHCTDECATNWPPLLLGDADLAALSEVAPGKFGTTERADGEVQVIYNGDPLYTFANDSAAGDISGQGVNDVWWVANLNPVLQMSEVGELGPILTGPTGMTLYTYANDTPGVSNCTDECAANWPPLLGGFSNAGMQALAGAGVDDDAVGTIERADGTTQLTYNDMPLYYWVQDMAPGDTTGQGVGDVWQVATP
jgi:predicted lipoprotein with Yx(FWY)xxD motif